jgi:hypothetical protein
MHLSQAAITKRPPFAIEKIETIPNAYLTAVAPHLQTLPSLKNKSHGEDIRA